MPNTSAWAVSASPVSLAVVTTAVSGSSQENVNYLTNADKIALMAQYTAALATKTALDATAASLSISHAAYDTSIANISTGLIDAGAPANWATIWPDGTTSGPWPNIQTDLANLWAQVAVQQTALQTAISSAQSAASFEASVNTALALLPGQSIVPNGGFSTGDTTGWVNSANASIAAEFGTIPAGGKGVSIPPGGTVVSHSFPVTNGQIYAVTAQGSGTGVNVAIYYGSSAAPNVFNQFDGTYTGATALLSAGTLNPATQYPWTAPSGATYASVVLYNAGSSTVYLSGVMVIPYVMAQNILAGAITAGAIAAGAITADIIKTGTLNAADVDVVNLNANNITTGTLAATQVVFPDGSALSTASRVLTLKITPTLANACDTNDFYAVPGMGWTFTTEAVADTCNVFAGLSFLGTPTNNTLTPQTMLVLDGNTSSPAATFSGMDGSFVFSLTGLTPGSHTMQLYWANASGFSLAQPGNAQYPSGSYLICQLII